MLLHILLFLVSFTLCQGCDDGQFTCDDGECIVKSWKCDGSPDCPDESDEKDCPEKEGRCDYNTQFFCDGICLSNTWLCDGDTDCLDKTDEAHCSNVTTTVAPTTTTVKPPEPAKKKKDACDRYDCNTCIKYKRWMDKNCAAMCKECKKCEDKNEYCQRWSDLGHCKKKYAKFMKRTCRKSCGFCTDPLVKKTSGLCLNIAPAALCAEQAKKWGKKYDTGSYNAPYGCIQSKAYKNKMGFNTKKTDTKCSKENPCYCIGTCQFGEDKTEQCPGWKDKGFCKHWKFGKWMRTNCQKSCHICKTEDKDKNPIDGGFSMSPQRPSKEDPELF